MKSLFLISLLATVSSAVFSQQDSTSSSKQEDTLYVGKMVIIRKKDGYKSGILTIEREERSAPAKKRTSNVSTNWLVIDLGVNRFKDGTNYNSQEVQSFAPGAKDEWFDLQNGKSINFNLWFFMQRMNMIKHVVNLQYGLGVEFNNYRFSQPIVFTSNPTQVVYDASTSYKKNKLAANYLTIPLMVNFKLTPDRKNKGLGFSAGISTGYLFSSRQKTITAAEGKKKTRDDFALRPWKFAYIGELQLGPIKLYGSFADRSMFKKGLDFTPYNVGFRISSL